MGKKLRGDGGLSDLIDLRHVPKFDVRFEALGALDEASSALGVVRSSGLQPEASAMVLEIQRDLCWMMSEMAAVSDNQRPPTHITADRLTALEEAYESITKDHPLVDAFTVPGDSMVGALIHLARAIIRRAERNVALLHYEVKLSNENILPYLNRLSTLMYAMGRAEETAAGIPDPTIARPSTGGF